MSEEKLQELGSQLPSSAGTQRSSDKLRDAGIQPALEKWWEPVRSQAGALVCNERAGHTTIKILGFSSLLVTFGVTRGKPIRLSPNTRTKEVRNWWLVRTERETWD